MITFAFTQEGEVQMITITDDETGTEVKLSSSRTEPGKTRATIYGPTEDSVQTLIAELANEYGCAEFTVPVAVCDGQFGATGQVWEPSMLEVPHAKDMQ